MRNNTHFKMETTMRTRFSLPKGKKGLTIEYAILMMALSVAFIALVLTTASISNKNAASYQNYAQRKAVLDEIGQAYITAQGAKGCLDEFAENDFGYFWRDFDKKDLVVLQGDLQLNEVVLRIHLNDDGSVQLYRYGV